MNHEFFFTGIKAALGKPLPGTNVQWEMASSDRMIKDFPRQKRHDSRLAAVLILLYPADGKIHTLFIQRPVYNGVHSGQISFPGGKMEKEDRSLEETAVRETCEELGISGEEINILGKLTPLFIPVSNIEVSPFVAWSNRKPFINHNREEVVSIIEVPLKYFMGKGIVREKLMEVRGEEILVKYYDFDGLIIWGATAMILHELLVLMKREGILIS